jgi:uncharacterized protein
VSGELDECRPGCGACCIAASISSPLPGLPRGKPADLPCPYLTAGMGCAIFGDPGRPAVCGSLKRLPEMCGASREDALAYLERMERMTKPE